MIKRRMVKAAALLVLWLSAALHATALAQGLPGAATPTNTTPSQPPAFSASIQSWGQGFVLYGTFPGIIADFAQIARVRPMVSRDGVQYGPLDPDPDCEANYDWNLESWDLTDPAQVEKAQTQRCSVPTDEPFKSYLAGTIESFYLRLHITAKDGTQYDTQAAKISRATPQPLPPDMTVQVLFPKSMKLRDRPYFPEYGVYCVTANQGATPGEIRALLPDALALEVQFFQDGGIVGTGKVDVKIDWPLPTGPITSDYISQRAVPKVEFPQNAHIATQSAIYIMEPFPALSMPLELRVQTVPRGAKASPALYEEEVGEGLYLGFEHKPSGATAIHLSYSLDGGATWVRTKDVLLHDAKVDAVPKEPHYAHAILFKPDETPYKECVEGTVKGFQVRVDIEGGVFGGTSEVLPWPASYAYKPPPKQPTGGDGSGGNRGDAGANQEGTGGIRPGIPSPEPVAAPEKPAAEKEDVLDSAAKTTAVSPDAPQRPDLPVSADVGTGDTQPGSGTGPAAPHTEGASSGPGGSGMDIGAEREGKRTSPLGVIGVVALGGAATVAGMAAVSQTALGGKALSGLVRLFKSFRFRP